MERSNVLISPHVSARLPGLTTALAKLFLDKLERPRGGLPLRKVVDKSAGFV